MDSRSGPGRPVICSHCRHLNPAGSSHCELCWKPIDEGFVLGAAAASATAPPSPTTDPQQAYYDQLGYHDPARYRPPSKTYVTFALIGVFIFLTPVLVGAGCLTGCLTGAVIGGEKGMMLMIPGSILGLLASIWILVMMGRAMYRG
jgi:hypothetical protein